MYQLNHPKTPFITWLVLLTLTLVLFLNSSQTSAQTVVQSRFAELSNANTSAESIYLVGFTYTNTTTPVGSINIQFCSNSPLISDPCTFPTGMDVSSTVLSNQSGNTGFTLAAAPAGQINLSRNPADPIATPSTYELDDIVNPVSAGQYYLRIETFSSTDSSGPDIEQGGIAIYINPAFTVDAVVPPYLAFCEAVNIADLNCDSASGNQINFGNFSTHSTSSATSQFLAATNAQGGYNVTLNGTTLTSGNNIIPPMTNLATSRSNTNQFGINLVGNSQPSVGSGPSGPGVAQPGSGYGVGNNYLFNSGNNVAGSTSASDYNKFTISYIININSSQPVGIYATTLTYICLANF